jgi:hypothetical protein
MMALSKTIDPFQNRMGSNTLVAKESGGFTMGTIRVVQTHRDEKMGF